MVHFHNLPVEVVVMIMAHCSSPQDVFSLIKADARTLGCFLDNRRQALKPHVGQLMGHYGRRNYAPSLLIAQLRHAKQYHASVGSNTEDTELVLPSIIREGTLSDHHSRQLSYQASLSTLCALSALATEIRWVITKYAPQAWKNIRKDLNPSREKEDELRLSITEHQRFWNAACRFEGYIQAFFRQEETLFPMDLHLRRRLLVLSSGRGESWTGRVDSFYSITRYVYDQHWSMLQNVMRYVASTNTQPINEMTVHDASIQKGLQRRLQHCTLLEMTRYAHYLTSQGLGMLLHLQSMTLKDQTQFVLSSIQNILGSPHPAIFIVNGIKKYSMGTVEEHNWKPWVFCEEAFGEDLDHWRKARSFWDNRRIYPRNSLRALINSSLALPPHSTDPTIIG